MAAAKTRMEKAVDDFRKELGTLRTGARMRRFWMRSAWIITAPRCP